MAENPFFAVSQLPYNVPDFPAIKFEHFQPAFERGMLDHKEEIAAIKQTTESPTFENTIVALENSGRLLQRATIVFGNLCSANTSPELQKLQLEYAPLFAAHSDGIRLDSTLYARVRCVFDNRSSLCGEDLRLVEITEQTFRNAGAQLDDEKKDELKQLNGRIASLESSFATKLLEVRKSTGVVIDNESELQGLSADELKSCAAEASQRGFPGQYVLSLTNTTQQSLLETLENRETRRKLHEASIGRCLSGESLDTRPIITELVKLRLRKSKLLGQSCFTDWKLLDQMADRSSAQQLLQEIVPAAVKRAQEEAAEIRSLMNARGDNFDLAPWDWTYYSALVRKEKYNLDESDVKPYFEFTSVLERGAFFVAEQLYGIAFKRRNDLPSYNEDVACYEVFDSNGQSLALFFVDPFTRPNKKGGAWMTSFVRQSIARHQKPVIYNVLNLVKPVEGRPTLLSSRNVRTVFHEFGHALHGIFSNVRYASLSGTSVPRDFVEFPSQINEKWALVPQVLQNYAIHYETGKIIPQELVEKILSSSTYGAGFQCVELMKATVIDLFWHTVEDETDFSDAEAMEANALVAYGLDVIDIIPPRYKSTYFAHIFQGGYASSYYAYTWAKVLDCDGFEWFTKNGGLLRENGNKFRECILSKGNSVDLNNAYVALTGGKPSIDAYLREQGFPLSST